jgi:hypothetical protein
MTVGSRWFKFDFHNHTPASDDYRVPDLQPREWLLAYMRQQVDCVVISDHNSGAWIDVLKAELANMSRDASSGELADFRPLTLFPGWSSRPPATSISPVLHTQSTSAEVERLLAQCNNNFPIPRETPNHQLVLQLGPRASSVISVVTRKRFVSSHTLMQRKAF